MSASGGDPIFSGTITGGSSTANQGAAAGLAAAWPTTRTDGAANILGTAAHPDVVSPTLPLSDVLTLPGQVNGSGGIAVAAASTGGTSVGITVSAAAGAVNTQYQGIVPAGVYDVTVFAQSTTAGGVRNNLVLVYYNGSAVEYLILPSQGSTMIGPLFLPKLTIGAQAGTMSGTLPSGTAFSAPSATVNFLFTNNIVDATGATYWPLAYLTRVG